MGGLVFEFVLRTTLIAVGAAVVLQALRIRTAAAQHSIWTGVLGLMLTLPVLILWAPKLAVPVLPSNDRPLPPAIPNHPPSSAWAIPWVEEEESGPAPIPHSSGNVMWIGAYLLGASVLLLRLVIGTIRTNRLDGACCAVPVTVGLFRPRMILPDGWKEWPQAQLDAVLTHEHAHVRRRDPLVQWLALLNRALFWFHPLAWWLERHLSALAEEACDAAVLQQGHDPRNYSSYLLDLARVVQGAGTRVNVTGMTMPGSNLAQRIRKIVAGISTQRVSRARMTSAASACAICSAMFAAGTVEHIAAIQPLRVVPLAVRAPMPELISTQGKTENTSASVVLAQAREVSKPQVPTPTKKPLQFDVASVKPTTVPEGVTIFGDGRRMMRKGAGIKMPRNTGGPGTDDPGRIHFPLITLHELLTRAYGSYYEIKGPGWMDSQAFAIEATMPVETTKEQFQEMLRNLLSERFQLKYHAEMKDVTGYALTVGKDGPKMKESPQQNEEISTLPFQRPTRGPDGVMALAPNPGPWSISTTSPENQSRITDQQQTMQQLAQRLGFILDTVVSDETGLTLRYDYTVAYAGGSGHGQALPSSMPASPPEASVRPPDIFGALSEQLGLRLEKKKLRLEVMVVDQVEKTPTSN